MSQAHHVGNITALLRGEAACGKRCGGAGRTASAHSGTETGSRKATLPEDLLKIDGRVDVFYYFTFISLIKCNFL